MVRVTRGVIITERDIVSERQMRGGAQKGPVRNLGWPHGIMQFRLGVKGLPHKKQQASYFTEFVCSPYSRSWGRGARFSAGPACIIRLCL